MSVVHHHGKIKAATFSEWCLYMYVYTLHVRIVFCMNYGFRVSDDFNVVKCYTILQWNLFWKKNSHRKWYCFIMWLQGSTSKSGTRGKTTTGKSDPCCQLRDIPTRPERFPDIFGDFGSHKQVLTNLATCDMKACPLFMTLTSSGGSCEPSPVLKHLWQSVSLCSLSTTGWEWTTCPQNCSNF